MVNQIWHMICKNGNTGEELGAYCPELDAVALSTDILPVQGRELWEDWPAVFSMYESERYLTPAHMGDVLAHIVEKLGRTYEDPKLIDSVAASVLERGREIIKRPGFDGLPVVFVCDALTDAGEKIREGHAFTAWYPSRPDRGIGNLVPVSSL